MRIPYILLSIIFLSILSVGCSHESQSPELRRLDKETNDAMARFADSTIDSLATLLLDKATKADNALYQGKAHFYLSSFSRRLDSITVESKLEHLDKAEAIAIETGNDTLLACVYNLRGIWELGNNLAPVTARYWFNKSIETATPLEERWISIPAEINMLEACRLTGDTLGIKYGRELFEYACQSRQPELMFSTGLNCAMYYARTASDTTELAPFIKAIETLPDMASGIKEMLYATYFYNKKDYESAARFMEKANPEKYNDFCVLYGEILNKLERFDESDLWLDKAGPEYGGVLFPDLKERVLRVRAINAAARKDWRNAYISQKRYEAMRDSADEINLRDISKRYNVEYEVNIKDRQILTQKQRLNELKIRFSWAIACVIMIVVSLGIYNWKRRKFYRDIVRQNLDFIERQKEYEQRLCDSDTKTAVIPSDTGSSKLNDSRIDEIFDKIRVLSEEKQVWRDVSISRDSFADMVGCNRTYFTEAIKARTGMSYTQYMNSCRTREAIKILSDTSDNISLKDLASQLGFLTLANFYASFKKETGMSPAAFRKTARELKTENKHTDNEN